jgi:hypothetical protein
VTGPRALARGGLLAGRAPARGLLDLAIAGRDQHHEAA